MILDITHVVAFLVGALSGASGHYLGTKYTEQRHRKEHEKQMKKQFEHLKNLMPKILEEMREDVKNDKTKIIREFFIIPRKGMPFSSSKPVFQYYEDEHDNLRGKIDILEETSYLTDLTLGNTPIYRMSEEFVDLLLKLGK